MNVARISRMVQQTEADAWVVGSASRRVLEWFVDQERPAFALFGRRRSLPIAGVGPDHEKAGREMVRRLIELGHKRIVILVRASQRADGMSLVNKARFEEMEAHGLSTGPYNLPDWENSPAGLRQCLKSLFQVTPPTAILVDDWMLYYAIQTLLIRERGPEYRFVSCISMAYNPSFICLSPGLTLSSVLAFPSDLRLLP